MCGICGFVALNERPGTQALEADVAPMTEALRHRGPDAGGVWSDERHGVALGHRRLSIIDLSADGAQPMTSACRRYTLVYNGEIYDFQELRGELEAAGHKLRGHSDTEVLVEAISRWGPRGAIERCNGMFAFAVWDAHQATLTLARDRVGKKPLYYGVWGGRFFFASELKALRAHRDWRGEIDRDALAHFVQYSYIPAPHSIFVGLRKLPAGTLLVMRPGASEPYGEPVTWWSARSVVEAGAALPFGGSALDATDALEALLLDSVERRMVSDVDLGALLSGGLDSTAVVALMKARSTRPVRTFSIGFRERGHDEADNARAIAEHLGTDHRELYLTPEDALAVVPELPRLYDEPFADTSQIPTLLVCRMAREHVTVALSGDGGDELFAGYNRYFRALERWRRLARLPPPLRHGLGRALDGLAAASWKGAPEGSVGAVRALGGRLGRVADAFVADGIEDLFARMNTRCRDASALVPGSRALATLLSDPTRWPQLPDPLQWMMFADFAGHMAEDILVKVDRASMGVSLEVRSPLLDHRVVEFAASVPLGLKVGAGGETKWLLRQVIDRHVPRALTDQPKMGFGMPIGQWLRGPLREWAEALLDQHRLRQQGWFDAPAVGRVWQQHRSGWRDWRFLVWNLLVFQAWLDEWQQ